MVASLINLNSVSTILQCIVGLVNVLKSVLFFFTWVCQPKSYSRYCLCLHLLGLNLGLYVYYILLTTFAVGSSLQRKLLEISNSLSEAELTRMKLLARPKVNGFRLAKMRRGLELFKELESTGESHAYVRELLKGIRRYDLLVKLDAPLLNNTESGKSSSVFSKRCTHHFLKTWIQLK